MKMKGECIWKFNFQDVTLPERQLTNGQHQDWNGSDMLDNKPLLASETFNGANGVAVHLGLNNCKSKNFDLAGTHRKSQNL